MVYHNYHTHSEFCDGSGSLEEIAEIAFDRGFGSLGFSSHAPWVYPNDWCLREDRVDDYFLEIQRVKKLFKGRLTIYSGLEIDYVPEHGGLVFDPKDSRLDYCLGSVHSLGCDSKGVFREVDGSLEKMEELVAIQFAGDIKEACAEYYKRVAELSFLPIDILGHFDLIKKKNLESRFFDESAPWYLSLAKDTLKEVAKSDVILELNTGGMARAGLQEPYPSPLLLAEANKLGIRISLNADSHTPDGLSFAFEESLRLLKDCGYEEIQVLDQGNWRPQKIS